MILARISMMQDENEMAWKRLESKQTQQIIATCPQHTVCFNTSKKYFEAIWLLTEFYK